MSEGQEITVGVHARLDAPGFVVKVTAGEGNEQRVTRIPVDDFGEAEKLARSIVRFVEVGLPIDALLGNAGEEGGA